MALGLGLGRRGQTIIQSFLWVFWLSLAVVVLALSAGVVLSDGFRATALDIAGMGWLPWMGVVAAVGAIGAAIWLTLVRRAQAR